VSDQTPPEPVSIELEGKKYEGTFTLGNRTITVNLGLQASSTSFGPYNDRALPLAQTLLREMVTGKDRSKNRATYVNLRIKSLDDYWNMVVVPNVRDCIKEPSQRTVVNAVIVTWHVLDWAWHENNYGRDGRGVEFRDYKEQLLDECAQLGWVNDLADAAKHCGLGRETQSEGIVSLSLGADKPTIFVMEPTAPEATLGHLMPIQELLKIVTDFWLSKLKGRNLPSPFA
jgi:hypothetical protein